MKTFVCRVRLNESTGQFADIPFHGISIGQVISIIEAQYGRGAFLGCLSED